MKIITGDSLEELKKLDSESIEALITDPPYGLSKMTTENIQDCLTNWLAGDKYEHQGGGFMGKAWDSFVPSPELWKEVYRVMKHGAHGLVFAGSRTQDLMSISLRLAGFEVRDTLMWVYGSGFPKSHNISKAIDKKLGGVRKVIGESKRHGGGNSQIFKGDYNNPITAPSTEQAKAWKGWGTALKPAYEPIILVRKPLRGTVAQNTLEHGCGGINIDACRVETDEIRIRTTNGLQGVTSFKRSSGKTIYNEGRWPASLLIDEHIDQEEMKRYFYCAKASRKEREAGLLQVNKDRGNTHPTVKPLDLMRYLVKLITPPNGTVLDPFLGSGSTLCAVALEGKKGIGIEREPEYAKIAEARVKHWQPEEEPKSPLDKFMKG